MNTKLLVAIIAVIGIAVTFLVPLLAMGAGIVVWIYLVYMGKKGKADLFREYMEPGSAEKRYKMLKTSLLVGGIFLGIGIVGIVLHNVLSVAWETEEAVSFFVGLAGLWAFIVSTVTGLIVFIIGRRKQTKEIPE
jgi:hypothetical protein